MGGGSEASEVEIMGYEAQPAAAADGVRNPVLRRAGDHRVGRNPRVGFGLVLLIVFVRLVPSWCQTFRLRVAHEPRTYYIL